MKAIGKTDTTLAGFKQPFIDLGFDWFYWDGRKSEFDLFDEEEPNILICNTHDLTPALIKCLNENKKTTTLLFDKDEYKHSLNPLGWKFYIIQERTEDLDVDGVNLEDLQQIVLPPMVDTTIFYPVKEDQTLKCDLGVYGPQNDTVYAMCYPIGELNIKIFGPDPWSVPQYMGPLSHEDRRRLYSSSKECWAHNVDEALRIIASGGFPVGENKYVVELLDNLSDLYYERVLEGHTYKAGVDILFGELQ